MGWWSIRKKEHRQRLVLGDEPADIMDETITAVRKVWKKDWQREPTMYELEALFRFCAAGKNGLHPGPKMPEDRRSQGEFGIFSPEHLRMYDDELRKEGTGIRDATLAMQLGQKAVRSSGFKAKEGLAWRDGFLYGWIAARRIKPPKRRLKVKP